MLDKRDIVNFFYTASFPLYGIGSFVAATINSPIGNSISVSAQIFILLFYCIDLLYKKQFKLRINGLFFLMILFQISSIIAYVVALNKKAPFLTELHSITRSAIILFPFYAFIAVCLYNEKDKSRLVGLTFKGLNILLFINVIGYYVFGLENGTHSIEGRLSLPFIDGMYSGACMIAVVNLMVFYYMKKALLTGDSYKFTYLTIYFLINLVLLFLVNSRLANLTFLFVFLLVLFNVLHRFKGLFLIGVFFVPLLLNLGLLLYQILTLPVFKVIMQRVDLKDVTTFNGRSFGWEQAIDWFLYDQTNVVFGNGYNGHYFLHLMAKIAKVWDVRETDTHLHSTSLSILVDQGIVGAVLILLITYRAYIYFKDQFATRSAEGALFAVMVFILIVMQVDMFVYRESAGWLILSLLAAFAAIDWRDSKNLAAS
jgi:O-antigen ligase